MITNLYLLRYNNKYNRIIKKLNSISEYSEYLLGSPLLGIQNFNFGDGVTTHQVITKWNIDYGNPDYLVIEDNNNPGVVHSRWFVVEAMYQSNGTYVLSLHRDTIADNINEVLNSTSLVDKGHLNVDNPLIYNSENVSFNQIKKGQYPIENKAKTPWLVAYLARKNADNTDRTYDINYKTINPFIEPGECPIPSYMFGTHKFIVGNEISKISVDYAYNNTLVEGISEYTITRYLQASSRYVRSFDRDYPHSYDPIKPTIQQLSIAFNGIYTEFNRLNGPEENAATGLYLESYINSLRQYENKTYMINGQAKTIKITIDPGSIIEESKVIDANVPSIDNIFKTTVYQNLGLTSGSKDNNKIYYTRAMVTIEAIPMTAGFTTKANFKFDDGAMTIDAPYEIIAIPYSDLSWRDNTGATATYKHTKEIAKSFMDALAKDEGCFDIQLVPYISWDVNRLADGVLDYWGDVNSVKYITNDAGSRISFFIRLPSASFSYQLEAPRNIPIDQDIKKSINCDLYRIVSPNGNGEFEFSPAKNGGFSYVDIECTLLPHQPYINVSPVFSNMYGQDYKDYRGLICGGDFSLPIMKSAWIDYQQQNKNFQQIFDRQIETMDFNNKINRTREIVGIGAGSLTGVAGGALTGSMFGPAGSIIGGIAGGVTSLGGGIADVAMNDQLRERARQDAILNHDWSLGNIKARSQTLTRTTAFNIDNTFFPFVEYYSCTDEEKELFDQIMRYQGMTIGVIGKISDYLNVDEEWTFIKATLIDAQDIEDDTHLVVDINEQLEGGLRIYGNTTIN